MAPAQNPKKDKGRTKMGKKETAMEKKTTIAKKEATMEETEITMEKNETTKPKKEIPIEKKETTKARKETPIEKKETSMVEGETSMEKEEPAKKLKQRKHKHDSYSSYIYKVLKQVHPYTKMSKQAMSVMDSFMQDMFERIAAESSSLTKNNGRKVLSSHEIQTAVRLIFPGELSKHATIEGAKALQNYAINK